MSGLLSDRTTAYRQLAREAGVDAVVLTSEPAVQHSTGVHLFTQRLIPQRPVVAIVPTQGDACVVACVLERDQLEREHPGLTVRTYREFGDDPWDVVAAALPGSGSVLLEEEIPAGWTHALAQSRPGLEQRFSYELTTRPRLLKDAAEIEHLTATSRAADRAIAAGARALVPGATEVDVATVIGRTFEDAFPGAASEVRGKCTAPANNRSMHHESNATPIPEAGLVRLALVGRAAGYWMIISRMVVLGDDPALAAAYDAYVDVYRDVLSWLVPGAVADELYARCRARCTEGGFALETVKIGHGTGLDFRERPWLAPGRADVLEPGMVLAYDYGLEAVDGTVLHIEDRVLIGEDGPRLLSDLWPIEVPGGAGHERVSG